MYPNQFLPPVGPSPPFSYHVGVANVGLAPIFPPGLQLSGTGALGLLIGLVEPVLETVVTTLDSALVPTLGPILSVLGLDLAGADFSAVEHLRPAAQLQLDQAGQVVGLRLMKHPGRLDSLPGCFVMWPSSAGSRARRPPMSRRSPRGWPGYRR